MEEKTIELEIPILLPNINNNQDGCLNRLESAMSIPKGISQAHLLLESEPVRLCVHYNPDLISLEEINRISRRAGASISNRYRHTTLQIDGMDCSDCALVIEHSVSRMDGVLNASVSYAAQLMSVEYDSYLTSHRKIEQYISLLGYSVPSNTMKNWYRKNRQLIFSLTTGLLLLIAWSIERNIALPPLTIAGFYLPAIVLGGFYPARHALTAIRQRKLDTDLLMVLAALGSVSLGDFAEGTFLLFLFSLGHALEEKALQKTQNAIHSLAELTPGTATIVRDGKETEVPTEQVKKGETVYIRPGARFPIDGIIIEGASSVDQSPITGESIPVDRAPGDEAIAGSINGQGLLKVRATRLARDSTIARVIKAVEYAQTTKSHTQQLMDKFIEWFVPAVLIADLIMILVPPIFGIPFGQSFLRAMTVLVAASPCALALGGPAATLSGLAQAARNGVLVKGGIHLENVGQLQVIAFDKTGTITVGEPEVSNVIPLDQNHSREQLLTLAASLEAFSGHPLAKAILRTAQDEQIPLLPVEDVIELPGLGLQAKVNSSLYQIGNRKFILEKSQGNSSGQYANIDQFEDQGKTIVYLSKDRIPIGMIVIGDTLRHNVPNLISRLKKLGIKRQIVLSGDNTRSVHSIAAQAGLIDNPQNNDGYAVFANLSPMDKQNTIRNLIKEYRFVGMVGDGINDAPALAIATTGIAIGGAKTDLALETADIALLSADLDRLPFIIALGRATRRIIRQNMAIAAIVIVCLTALTLAGLSGIGVAVLIHEGSTLLVVLNGLRLLGFREHTK